MQLAMRSYGIFLGIFSRFVDSACVVDRAPLSAGRLFQSVPPHAHSTTVSQSGSAAPGQSSRSPPFPPPPSLTVDGSALRLRSCLLFNASEYSQDGQEGVRSVPSSCG